MALEQIGLQAVIEGTDKYVSDAARIQQAEKGIVAQAQTTETATRKSSFSFTELRSAVSLAEQGLHAAEQAYRAVIVPTVAYAKQVRDLSRTIGASAEESSKLIQAADDMNVSVSTLEAGLKAAIRKGIKPTTENLGKLADQYLSIQDPIARTKFLMDTFGRSGADLGPLMERGAAGIKAAGDEAERLGLVLSAKDVQAARDFEIATDNLDDRMQGLKIRIGNALIPTLAGYLTQLQRVMDGENLLVVSGQMWSNAIEDVAHSFGFLINKSGELTNAIGKSDGTIRNQSASFDELAAAEKDVAKYQEDITKAQQDWLTTTADDVVKQLEAAGIHGRNFADALGVVDDIFGTETAKAAEREAALKKIIDQFKRTGDVKAFQDQLRSFYAGDLYNMAAAADTTGARFDHAFGVVIPAAVLVGQRAIDSLHGTNVTNTVTTVFNEVHTSSGGGGSTHRRQHGGLTLPGDTYSVNEAGMESGLGLVSGMLSLLRGTSFTPREPTMVIPAERTRDLISPALLGAGRSGGGNVSNSQSVSVGPNYISGGITQAQFNQRLRTALGA